MTRWAMKMNVGFFLSTFLMHTMKHNKFVIEQNIIKNKEYEAKVNFIVKIELIIDNSKKYFCLKRNIV